MRRRKSSNAILVVLGVLTAAALLLVCVVAIVALENGVIRPPSIPPSAVPFHSLGPSYRSIKTGMSRSQVVSVMGNDFVSEAEMDFQSIVIEPGFEPTNHNIEVLGWRDSDRLIVVGFHNGKVITKGFYRGDLKVSDW